MFTFLLIFVHILFDFSQAPLLYPMSGRLFSPAQPEGFSFLMAKTAAHTADPPLHPSSRIAIRF